jgi:hypothetical protein
MTRPITPPSCPPEPVPVVSPVPGEAREVLLGNFAGHLFAALARKPPCTLRVNASLADPTRPGPWWSAALVVAAGPPLPGRSLSADAVAILDVLGGTDEEMIRKIKLPAFRALPACREIVLVQDRRIYCEVHRRLDGARWITDLLLDRDARLRLDGAGLDLPLSVLYAQTGVGRP